MWHTGLIAPWHVGSSRTRARTCVPCIGRRILNHCAARKPVIFSFCDIFVWFWYQNDGDLVECVSKCSSLCYILEVFEKDRCLLFSKCLLEFACEAIWPWAFVCWKIFSHSFNFSTCDWSVHIFCFFLVHSRKVMFSKNLSISSRLSILLAYSCL